MPYDPKPGITLGEIDTPALIVDLDAFEHNLHTMAAFFDDRPAALRPHAKTHKCPQIAHRQIERGAVGITCAKLGEAEIMAQAGIRDILVANQVVGKIKIDRLVDLAGRCDLMVAVDDGANVEDLSRACRRGDVSLRVLIEVDIGMGRCGVPACRPVLDLARQVVDAPGLQFAGLQAYEGHLVQRPDSKERKLGVQAAAHLLQETCELLEQEGLPVQTVSGGGTGTYDLSGSIGPWNEIQAGSYILMDAAYVRIRPEFRLALTVLSTVISRPTPERVITDAGMKAMTHEFGLPQPLDVPGLSLERLSEEHGKLLAEPPELVPLRSGDKVRFIPSHGCTTVNLHDRFYVVRNGLLVDIWPIAARGRAQ